MNPPIFVLAGYCKRWVGGDLTKLRQQVTMKDGSSGDPTEQVTDIYGSVQAMYSKLQAAGTKLN